MNCKQGCMAMVIRSNADNEGKVVTCVEMLGSDVLVECGEVKFRLSGGPWWEVDRVLNLNYNGDIYTDVFPFARDSALMPIEGEGEKEENKKEQYA